MVLLEIKSKLKNQYPIYIFNHYLKRFRQGVKQYADEFRWRLKIRRQRPYSQAQVEVILQGRKNGRAGKKKSELNILFVGYGQGRGGPGGPVVDRYAGPNLLAALNAFAKVTEFIVEYPLDGFTSFGREKKAAVNRDLSRMVGCLLSDLDVVIGQMSGWMIDGSTLKAIRDEGVSVINYSWDDTAGFYGEKIDGNWSGPAALASVVDLTLTSSRNSCLKYQAEGGLALFWPEAANPEIHKPFVVPFEYDVSFVGGCYGYRPLLIEFLRKHGVKVATFGPGWDGGMLSAEEMIKLYSRSRINLGFGGIGHMVKVQHLKGRDFEVPMSGGLYLTSYNAELEECYEIGKEIVCYKDKWDCLGKIRYLLNHPEEADVIRKAGWQRALRDHTWEQRLEQLFRLVGLLE
jgi:hypothetical protein